MRRWFGPHEIHFLHTEVVPRTRKLSDGLGLTRTFSARVLVTEDNPRMLKCLNANDSSKPQMLVR